MAEDRTEKAGTTDGPAKRSTAVADVRRSLAQWAWTICAFAALFLAVGALLVAIGANEDNTLVGTVLNVADFCDLGVFDRSKPIVEFEDAASRETKVALLNWGVAALCWLIVGRVLNRVIAPRG